MREIFDEKYALTKNPNRNSSRRSTILLFVSPKRRNSPKCQKFARPFFQSLAPSRTVRALGTYSCSIPIRIPFTSRIRTVTARDDREKPYISRYKVVGNFSPISLNSATVPSDFLHAANSFIAKQRRKYAQAGVLNLMRKFYELRIIMA